MVAGLTVGWYVLVVVVVSLRRGPRRRSGGDERSYGAVAVSRPLPDGTTERADATWLFGLFVLLFALSLILHQLWWDGFEVRSWHFLVVVAALWAALRPTSVPRFLALVAVEVWAVALDMPDVGSHTLLVLIVGVCVLVDVGWTTARSRRLPDGGTLFQRVAPFIGVQLLLVYAVAALAKMNTGFFDAGISCAATMSRQVAWFHPPLLDGSWRIGAAIWGTVLVEAALPVLLAVPRTRSLGLVVGVAFHAVLALAGNVPFSALALALYVVFLPTDTPERLRALTARRPALGRWAGQARRWGGSPAVFFLAVACWLAGSVVFTVEPATRPGVISHGTRLVLLAVIGAGIVLCLGVGRGTSQGQRARPMRLGHPVFAVGVVLVVANSLSPYLGLKTESSFTMFSNLYTEHGSWNHLLIPEAVRVFHYQDQLIRVTDSNDRGLEAMTGDGAQLVRYELERHLRSHPGTIATYTTTAAGVETTRTGGPEADAGLVTPVLDRIFKFQTVPPAERGGCSR